MKTKSIILIALTAFTTTVIVQNNEPVAINILWKTVEVAKLILFSGFFIVGLIVGLVIRTSGHKKEEGELQSERLSTEDQDYLSE